jgi:hypothetical protein
MRLGRLVASAGLWLAALAAPGWAQAAASPFADWAAIVVAGDFRAHSGAPAETFDNARRDVAKALVDAGFAPDHIRQFSVRPERYPAEAPFPSEIGIIRQELDAVAAQAREGCLIYFTSHGTPDGAVVGERLLTPVGAARMIGDACGERPTVVVMSACFSGVFVPALAGPNRMVLTAARPDRSSFGCGETDRYPYFDACLLESMPNARDFAALGRAAQACVSRREKEENLSPASEPQLAIGGEIRPLLPLLALRAPPPVVRAASAPGAPEAAPEERTAAR